MNAALATSSAQGRIWPAIFWAGLLCGIFDILAAFIVYGQFGAKPIPLLQGIASGVLGACARDGGLATALLGLACHFVIAYGAATAYVVASRFAPYIFSCRMWSCRSPPSAAARSLSSSRSSASASTSSP